MRATDDVAAVAAALASVRGGDPLRRATVAVPGPVPALLVRRALGERGGVANVDVVPLRRLAERLAGPLPSAHDGVPGAWEEATRLALDAAPGPFASVGRHPATVARVAASLRTLRVATAEERAGLVAKGGRAAHQVALLEAVEARGPWRQPVDVVRAAIAALRDGADPGPTVVLRPSAHDPLEQGLVACLAGQEGVVVVDGPVGSTLPDHLVVAPDAETEARLAVQACADALRTGTPGHRILVLPLGGAVARRRVGQLLDAAGIEWNGPSGRTLASGPAGRAVLGLLRLPEDGWTVRSVLAVLADAPFRHPTHGGPLPLGRWAAVCADAHVAGGPDWAQRLHRWADRAEERTEGPVAAAADARDLATVHADLVRLSGGSVDASWTDRATTALEVLDRWLDPGSWPEAAAREHEAVRTAIGSLARLDDLGGTPTPPAFVAAVEAVLAAATPRHGRVGVGVHVASPHELVGATPALLVLTGAVEGAAPARRSEDALLPDDDLGLVSGAASRAAARAADRSAIDRAIASSERCVASCHLADAQAARFPSRWLLTWAGELHGKGRPLSAEELLEGGTDAVQTVVPSFTAAVTTAARATADLQEVALASLAAWRSAGGAVAEHPLAVSDVHLAAALERARALDGTAFGEHHGLLEPVLGLDAERTVTELETWAVCPRRHLVTHVLGAVPVQLVEDAVDVGGSDRGDLVHRVLERLVRERAPLAPDEPWGEAGRTRARDLLDEEVARREADGRLPTGTVARLRVEEMAGTILGALDLDDTVRAAEGWVATSAEGRFGTGVDVPVSLRLPSGREVRFRGRIDRLDRGEEGAVRVVDYKTGRARALVESATKRRGLAGRLQLGVYEEAARALVPGSTDVRSAWWLLEADLPDHERIVSNPLPREGLVRALDAVTDGIERGVFPANPGEDGFFGPSNCGFCPVDRACASDRVRRQQLVADDAVLEPWHRLAALDAELADGPGA